MSILFLLIFALIIVVTIILVFPFFVNVMAAITTLFRTEKVKFSSSKENFGIIITSYKDYEIALPLIDSLLNQVVNVPFHIYLIADRCKISDSDIKRYWDKPVSLLSPKKSLDSKVKSFIYAVNNEIQAHSAFLIFDPDNDVERNYLRNVNFFFQKGYKAVQTRRYPKNLDTAFACLDAAGEIYHNHMDRLVPFFLGSSSTLAGSGMAISRSLFLDYLNCREIQDNLNGVILGEDKVLQNHIVQKEVIIAYAHNVLTLDEKITSKAQVKTQRIRWIQTYIENIRQASGIFIMGLKNFNKNQIIFGGISLYPPLFIVVLFSILLFAVSSIVSAKISIVLVIGLTVFILNFFITLLFAKTPWIIYLSLLKIPLFVSGQIYSLFNLKKSKGNFMVTEKKKNTPKSRAFQ